MKFELFVFFETILLIMLAGIMIFGGIPGCGVTNGIGVQQVTVDGTPTALRRIVDNEAGVACFYIVYSGSVAMDCVPLSDTKLFQ